MVRRREARSDIDLRSAAAEVRFENVVKTYPDGTTALRGLDLTVPAGQITVFLGPSGCGKTTALRLVNRMVTPTRGRVTINGADVASMGLTRLRRQIGYVIQNAGLFPHRRVVDNVATICRLEGEKRAPAREKARGLLERVGLEASMGNKYPHQLSGGQQQRVGVARALAADPPILLMDEPFSAVDPIVRRDLQDELRALQAQLHKTVLVVTHDLDEAIRLADQVVVFRPGEIAQVGTPEEILVRPADDYVASFAEGTSGIAGMRWLSLVGTQHLRFAEGADTGHWRLTTNADGRASAWEGRNGKAPTSLAVRRTYVHGRDNLHRALDSAILSPSGQAIATDPHGRVLGLVSSTEIHRAIERAWEATRG